MKNDHCRVGVAMAIPTVYLHIYVVTVILKLAVTDI
jgi:hypothetical protein